MGPLRGRSLFLILSATNCSFDQLRHFRWLLEVSAAYSFGFDPGKTQTLSVQRSRQGGSKGRGKGRGRGRGRKKARSWSGRRWLALAFGKNG